ncbi:uncharacterized protein LOC141819519, partial [Curcuma longa]|uniref:uncharacterized protein LOC141819519 n=1 Tax=Curcuma longa TaxID=136217 RepID=UPI003D9F7401
MPRLSNFIKGLVSTKDLTRAKKMVALPEEVSNIILNKGLSPKLKDSGSFTIPCKLDNISIGRAFCDLGASVNIIPHTTSDKFGFTDLKLNATALQLADCSHIYSRGIVEDVSVEVGGFTIPTDFIVLDMKEDPSVPIILGRPFLSTAGAIIDMKNHRLSLEVGRERVEFDLSQDSKAILSEKKHHCELDDIQQTKK